VTHVSRLQTHFGSDRARPRDSDLDASDDVRVECGTWKGRFGGGRYARSDALRRVIFDRYVLPTL
jgi:hypothetical protein